MKRWIPLLAALLTVAACKGSTSYVDLLPNIYPDYIGVTVPAGIAPQNAGGTLQFTVLGRKDGQWTQWRDFVMFVSDAPLTDYGVTYRKIAPGYTTYSRIGLYQRDIHSFQEEPIIESTLTPGQCMNCHTANATDPSQFLFHLRGKHGATLVQQDGHREWVTTKTDSTLGNMAYCYWHPGGRWVAGSINPVRQCFWTGDQQPIEVFDTASDLVVMDLRDHSLIVDPRLTTEDWLESSPAFTPDGKTLYFCKAKAYDVPRQVDSIRYDLMRVSFDAETGALGEIETVIPASGNGRSVSFPRPSYDGRWLMYNESDFGVFPIDHKEADLWLMDLATGQTRPIDEVNSPLSESFHNWSSDSRWFLFSSRRGDGTGAAPSPSCFRSGIPGSSITISCNPTMHPISPTRGCASTPAGYTAKCSPTNVSKLLSSHEKSIDSSLRPLVRPVLLLRTQRPVPHPRAGDGQ